MESSATLPMTSRLIRSHPVRGREAEKRETVGQHGPGGARELQPCVLDRCVLAYGTGAVIPAMHDAGEVVQVDADAVRLAIPPRTLHLLGELAELLEQLEILGCRQRGDVERAGDVLRRTPGRAEDAAEPRMRH